MSLYAKSQGVAAAGHPDVQVPITYRVAPVQADEQAPQLGDEEHCPELPPCPASRHPLPGRQPGRCDPVTSHSGIAIRVRRQGEYQGCSNDSRQRHHLSEGKVNDTASLYALT